MQKIKSDVINTIDRFKIANESEQNVILKEIIKRLNRYVNCNNEIFEKIEHLSAKFEKDNPLYVEDEAIMVKFSEECKKIRNIGMRNIK